MVGLTCAWTGPSEQPKQLRAGRDETVEVAHGGLVHHQVDSLLSKVHHLVVALVWVGFVLVI